MSYSSSPSSCSLSSSSSSLSSQTCYLLPFLEKTKSELSVFVRIVLSDFLSYADACNLRQCNRTMREVVALSKPHAITKTHHNRFDYFKTKVLYIRSVANFARFRISFPKLTRIALTNRGLHVQSDFLTSLPDLEELVISGHESVGFSLPFLRVSSSNYDNDFGILRDILAGSKLKKLRSLTLTKCKLMDDTLSLLSPSLRHLTLDLCNNNAFSACLARLPFRESLESLKLVVEGLTTLDNVNFAPFRSLLHLDITESHLHDAAFALLTSLHTLKVSFCTQITDELFMCFPHLHTLDITGCLQITDAAFTRSPFLLSLRSFRMDYCTLTDNAIARMKNLDLLSARGVKKITDASVATLTQLTWLSMSGDSVGITDAAFACLFSLRSLSLSNCTHLTNAMFVQLRYLLYLDISGCTGLITDAAFASLSFLVVLDMSQCSLHFITNAVFAHLRSLRRLYMEFCKQPTITVKAFDSIPELTDLNIHGCTQLDTSMVANKLKNLRCAHHTDMKFNYCSYEDCVCGEFDLLQSIRDMDQDYLDNQKVQNVFVYEMLLFVC